MFVQVVSSVFDLMETHESTWRVVRAAEEVPLFGFPHGVGLEPVPVNVDRMLTIFRQATRDLREIWELALAPQTLDEILALTPGERPGPFFPPDVWVRAIYDFAVAYHRRRLDASRLLKSLVPLYLGRTASFVLETAESGAVEVERIIRELADVYVGGKDYLVRRWTDPSRQASG
jgi:hypothetical protein